MVLVSEISGYPDFSLDFLTEVSMPSSAYFLVSKCSSMLNEQEYI